MTKLKNSMGFSAVEALLILIVVGILGFTGWFVYHSQKVANKNYSSQPSATQTPTTKKPTKPTNQYAGWKTFCSSETNACFKYDPSWTFTQCAPVQVNMQGRYQNCPSAETASVISPDNTRIDWFLDPYDASATNYCTQGKTSYPGVTYSDITSVKNASNMFFVNVKEDGSSGYDYNSHLALTTGDNGRQPTVGQSNALCPPVPAFLSKDGKFKITFDYGYSVNTNPKLPASDQNAAPSEPDLNSVKLTLLSFYYK
jgi:hypothetical protein